MVASVLVMYLVSRGDKRESNRNRDQRRESALAPRKLYGEVPRRMLRGRVFGQGLIAAALVSGVLAQPTSFSFGACERALDSLVLEVVVDRCDATSPLFDDAVKLDRLGYAYSQVLGDPTLAEQVADRLIAQGEAGRGYRLKSTLALDDGKPERAFDDCVSAERADIGSLRTDGKARDLLCQARAAWTSGWFEGARQSAEEAIQLIGKDGSRSLLHSTYLVLADTFRMVGDLRAANDALDQAPRDDVTDCERMWWHFKKGMVLAESTVVDRELAELEFDEAQNRNAACNDQEIREAVPLNISSLYAIDRPAYADAVLDAAFGPNAAPCAGPSDLHLDTRHDLLFLRGVIAGNQGDFERAERLLREASECPAPDENWYWEVEYARAVVAAQRGDVADAERRYLAAIDLVAALRANTTTLKTSMVSSHRPPYDGLIALLAQQGRWREVVEVMLKLDARDMLRATVAAASDAPDVEIGEAAAPPASVTVDQLLEAWRGRELLLVVAPVHPRSKIAQPLIRVRIVDGELSGELVGWADEARDLAAALYARPDESTTAMALGSLLVPEAVRHGDEPLELLTIGVLGKAPLSALRDREGELLVARRPLARVLSIVPRPRPAPRTAKVVILADPRGDLPRSREEGRLVAKRVGDDAELYVGDDRPATTARLIGAKHADVLVIGGHVNTDKATRKLELHDRSISATEVRALGLSPRLAVLASCGSAAAQDDQGWGSVAAALLMAGTDAVIATDRTVPDDDAFMLMEAFTRQPAWRSAPEQALARAQTELAAQGVPAAKWAPFVVLRSPPVAR